MTTANSLQRLGTLGQSVWYDFIRRDLYQSPRLKNRDHGDPKVRIRDDRAVAHADIRALTELGISMDVVARELEEEGVRKFADSFDELLRAIAEKERAMRVA